MAQRSSRRCKLSECQISELVSGAEPQPSRMVRIRSIKLSGKSLFVGHLPQRRSLARCKPLAQTRAQLADTFNPMDSGGQFRAQQSTVSRLICHSPHGGHSYVDCCRCEAALFQVKPVPQSHRFVECQSRFRTIPGDELMDRMLVPVLQSEDPRLRRTAAFECSRSGIPSFIFGRFFFPFALVVVILLMSPPSIAADYEVNRSLKTVYAIARFLAADE